MIKSDFKKAWLDCQTAQINDYNIIFSVHYFHDVQDDILKHYTDRFYTCVYKAHAD